MTLKKIPKHIWYGVVLPVVLVGLGTWQLGPRIKSYIEEYEYSATEVLKLLARDQETFRDSDRDKNGVQDYWTGDVADLLVASHGPSFSGASRFYGYYFITMKLDSSSLPPEVYQQDTDATGREVHHLNRFGFCAYPREYGWRTKHSFIINETNVVFRVNNGGKPVTEWPTDEELAERWERVEEE